jgi:hypothetical protein
MDYQAWTVRLEIPVRLEGLEDREIPEDREDPDRPALWDCPASTEHRDFPASKEKMDSLVPPERKEMREVRDSLARTVFQEIQVWQDCRDPREPLDVQDHRVLTGLMDDLARKATPVFQVCQEARVFPGT